jgi:hypothetical protein
MVKQLKPLYALSNALVTMAFLAALTGCSTAQIDSIPNSVGGLPAGAPERPAAAPAFPPVHDMPPPRASQMLDDDQQERLEKELIATRNRQSKQNPVADAALKAAEKKKADEKRKAEADAKQRAEARKRASEGGAGTSRNP